MSELTIKYVPPVMDGYSVVTESSHQIVYETPQSWQYPRWALTSALNPSILRPIWLGIQMRC